MCYDEFCGTYWLQKIFQTYFRYFRFVNTNDRQEEKNKEETHAEISDHSPVVSVRVDRGDRHESDEPRPVSPESQATNDSFVWFSEPEEGPEYPDAGDLP